MVKKHLHLLLLLLMCSCQESTNDILNDSASNKAPNTSKSIEAATVTTNTSDSDATEEFSPEDDCVRGQAEPVVMKKIFPQAVFRLKEDNFTGTETVEFENGDKLVITNGGCEYYSLIFRFETKRFSHDTTDINTWAKNAVLLMNEIMMGIDAPIDLEKGTQYLADYVTTNELELMEDLTFMPSEIASTVRIKRVQKITDEKYAVEVWYSVGPL